MNKGHSYKNNQIYSCQKAIASERFTPRQRKPYNQGYINQKINRTPLPALQKPWRILTIEEFIPVKQNYRQKSQSKDRHGNYRHNDLSI